MPVGTGSIKRAAKTAQAGNMADAVTEKEKKTRPKTVKEGTEPGQKAIEKQIADEKVTEKQTIEKKATKKHATEKQVAEKKVTEKQMIEKKAAGRENAGIEATNGMYQIGQQLPVHLL